MAQRDVGSLQHEVDRHEVTLQIGGSGEENTVTVACGLPPFPCRSPKEVGDVIALSDITPSGAADRSQEPSPVGSRRGRVTPNLSRASSDADHGVSRRMLTGRDEKVRNGGGSTEDQ